MKSGQILILVLLIVVVTLSVGLSVASRNLTNLKTSTQTEESQRAFSAAEGGVEDILSRLTAVQDVIKTGTASGGCIRDALDSNKANCTISGLGDTTVTASVSVSASQIYELLLDPGDVGQIDLTNGSTSYNGSLTIEWATSDEDQPAASLLLTFVCSGGSGCISSGFSTAPSGYRVKKYFLYDSTGSWPGESGTRTAVSCTQAGTYKCRFAFTSLNTNNAQFLRIRPLWKAATIKVTGDSNLPTQTYEVDSSANTTQGISRRVTVTRTALPTLPAAFDFALFSEGPIAQ